MLNVEKFFGSDSSEFVQKHYSWGRKSRLGLRERKKKVVKIERIEGRGVLHLDHRKSEERRVLLSKQAENQFSLEERGERFKKRIKVIRLRDCIQGIKLYGVERKPGEGIGLARAAGCSVEVLSQPVAKGKGRRKVKVRRPSGLEGYRDGDCRGYLGRVSMEERSQRVLGKAGRKR